MSVGGPPSDPERPAAAIRLTVCADDFGLSDGVNNATLDLAAAGRVSAVSCLVDGAACRSGAAQLSLLGPRVDKGLHLNLTEPLPAGPPVQSLARLIGQAYAGRLDAGVLRRELRRQLDRFEQIFGATLDHVDGHQHVHQLPGVRQVLLAELRARYPGRLPWLRGCRSPGGWFACGVKANVIASLGASALAVDAARLGFAVNRRLLGVYGFDDSAPGYAARLSRWLDQAGTNDLLMCHPGRGDDAGDPIASARRVEYRALADPAFIDALAVRGVKVTRLAAQRNL